MGKIIDPFLCMNIICPLGSYDVNVEPAKDDVLFTDVGLVLCMVGKFFDSVYGEPRSDKAVMSGPEKLRDPQGIELMLARRKTPAEPFSGAQPEKRASLNYSATAAFIESGISASDEPLTTALPSDEDDNDNLDGVVNSPSRPVVDDVFDEDDLRSIQVSNPWAFAKLNASFRAHDGNNQLPTPRRQAGDVGHSMRSSSSALGDTSPRRSDMPPHGRAKCRFVDESSSSPPASFPYPLKARGPRKAAERIEKSTPPNREISVRGSLDTWVNSSDDRELRDIAQGPADVAAPDSFVSARTLLGSTPFSNVATGDKGERRKAPRQRQHQRHGSPVAPVNDLEKVWFDVGEKSRKNRSEQTNSKHRQPLPDSLFHDRSRNDESCISSPAESTVTSMHPDLAVTLDYEARKRFATQQHREKLRRQAAAENRNLQSVTGRTSVPTTSPHRNRQRAAIAALHTNDEASPNPESPPIFEPDDPRAYLIRTRLLEEKEDQKPADQRKTIRKKTNLLPFETLLSNDYVGDLIQIVDTKPIKLDVLLHKSSTHDDFIRDGIDAKAFPMRTASQVQAWERALKTMVKTQYRIEGMPPEEEMEGELDCDLSSILRNLDAT